MTTPTDVPPVPAADDAQRPSKRLRRGLDTSIVENSSAFGFSIMITGSFGALGRLEGQPGIATAFGFAMGAPQLARARRPRRGQPAERTSRPPMSPRDF